MSAAIAVVLGLSVRFVHARVERFVDSVFFRKRHDDERALAQFAKDAPYVTDPTILLARAGEALRHHAGVSFARILVETNRAFGELSENDPAIVRLRATQSVLDLRTIETQIDGELAYPMAARGRLVGVLVLGPRVSGESYAPDESVAIAQVATSLGNSLDAFAKQREVHHEIVEAIRAVLIEMHAAPPQPAPMKPQPAEA